MKQLKTIINILGVVVKYGVIAAAFAKAAQVFYDEIKHLGSDETPDKKSLKDGDK